MYFTYFAALVMKGFNNDWNVAIKGWNGMPDLDIKIGYSKENGFFKFDTIYEV